MPTCEKLLTKEAIGELLGLQPTTITRWAACGRFPAPVRISRRAVRWPESVVSEWIKERAADAPA